jgi:predicted phage tail protein
MIRNIRLYGSLAKVAKQNEFRFDCDNQHQLFAGLKAMCPELDLTLRQLKTFSIVSTESDDEVEPKTVYENFQFGKNAKYIHVCPSTEGAWWYVFIAIAMAVLSYAVTRLTMPDTNHNNGAGSGRSTMFNGPTNQTDQGGPIPIIYGKKVLVGSTIIAADADYYNTI